MPRYAAFLLAALLAVSGVGVVSTASAPPPAANAVETLWPLYKTAYSGTIYELVNNSTPTPISFERWRDTYNQQSPLPTPTNYVKYPWSASIYAVTFWPGGESAWEWNRLSFTEWRSAGGPNARNAGWIKGSYYYKWGTSAELFVEGEDGVNHKLSYAEWQESGLRTPVDRGNEGFVKLTWTNDIVRMNNVSGGQGAAIGYGEWQDEAFPSPQAMARIPGDQFYRNLGDPTIYYAGPAMNRPVTFNEWKAAGFPAPRANSNLIPGNGGMFLVGWDVSPGMYRSDGNDGCYWARLRGTGGNLSDIIANFFGDGTTYVTISASDMAFETHWCGNWIKVG